MRPHSRQPTRIPCLWDSPGKNPGVGCHFLLQCVKVKSESEVAQSCPTLRDPMDRSLPGSSIHGIFQARVLEWGAVAFSVIYFLVVVSTVLFHVPSQCKCFGCFQLFIIRVMHLYGKTLKKQKISLINNKALVAQTVKNLPAMQETQVQSLDREDPLEKEIATHSSILV